MAATKDAAQAVRLSTVAQVLAYLEQAGRKVKKTKLYDDVKKGVLPRRMLDGKAVFRPVDVDRYATTLPLSVVPERQAQDAEDLARVKLAAEIDKLQSQKASIDLDRKIKLGKYVLREDVALELAARAGELDRALRTSMRLYVPDFVRLCAGDADKGEALTVEFEKLLDAALTEFSRPMEFETVFTDGDSNKTA